MLAPEIRYVVGIDVAKGTHTVCALVAQAGTIWLRPRTIEATAAGYAAVCALLRNWGEPPTILIGLEATGCLWEPLYEALTQAGYAVLVRNPRQTASWATSLGLRAKTDGLDAQTLARGLLAGYARASTIPSETVQEPRPLTRARRDLVQSQTGAKQRLRDELVVLFPELPDHTPEQCDLFTPALLQLLEAYSAAHALAQAPLEDVAATLCRISGGHWTAEQAAALQQVAQRSAASHRAVAARSLVVRTMARHLRDLQQHLADLERAIATVLAAPRCSTRVGKPPSARSIPDSVPHRLRLPHDARRRATSGFLVLS